MASRHISRFSRHLLLRSKAPPRSPFHPTLRHSNLNNKLNNNNNNSGRAFSSTPTSALPSENTNPQHEAQKDREKMNTDANETAKSGTDDTAAKNEEAAFDPNI